MQALEVDCFSLCICCWSCGLCAGYAGYSPPQSVSYLIPARASAPTYFGMSSLFCPLIIVYGFSLKGSGTDNSLFSLFTRCNPYIYIFLCVLLLLPPCHYTVCSVDGDPHFMIELPEREDALCFNINDSPGTIFNLVKDPSIGEPAAGQMAHLCCSSCGIPTSWPY